MKTFVTLILLLTASSGAPAQETAVFSDSLLEARTSAVASVLRCPVCQGESIQDSPAQLARQMRDVVKDQIRAGKSPEEIEAYFAARYGEWILLQPRKNGLNLALYALPAVATVSGLALVAFLVRRWSAT